jgi:DNA-binding beta-propeller fold protein YncE
MIKRLEEIIAWQRPREFYRYIKLPINGCLSLVNPFDLFKFFAIFSFLIVYISCAPPFKARIDTYGSRKIVWPGPPERPRIQYLWSVSLLGEEPETVTDFFFGQEYVLDPVNARSFRTPSAVYRAGERLYVVDPGAYRVSVIDLKTLDVFHIYRLDNEGRLQYPVSVVVDGHGDIYISDSEIRKVFVFNQEGKYVRSLDIQGLKRPAGLALSDGYLFVADSTGHRIYRMGLTDNSITSFGRHGTGDGEFNYPTFITVKKGRLYVTDSMNNRIQVFDIDGGFITKFGNIGDTYADLEKPKGVAVDSHGNVYVVDSIQDMVKIFDPSGRLLLFFGEKGSELGEFWLPSGIFIDNYDRIYVADTFNSRIQVFELIKDESGQS